MPRCASLFSHNCRFHFLLDSLCVALWQVMSRAAMIEWIMLDGLRDPNFAEKGT